MKKYWHVLNVGIQNTLVYRVNFLFRAAFGLIPLAESFPFLFIIIIILLHTHRSTVILIVIGDDDAMTSIVVL